MPKKKTKQRTYKAKSDKLYSKIIRSRGHCEAIGWGNLKCGYQLQCAHIISRTYSKVRTDTSNSLALCATHHMYFHRWPREFSHFITEKIGSEVYDQLKAKAQDTGKFDWESEYLRLQELWKSISE